MAPGSSASSSRTAPKRTDTNTITGGQIGIGVVADAADTTGRLRGDDTAGTSDAPVGAIERCEYTAMAISYHGERIADSPEPGSNGRSNVPPRRLDERPCHTRKRAQQRRVQAESVPDGRPVIGTEEVSPPTGSADPPGSPNVATTPPRRGGGHSLDRSRSDYQLAARLAVRERWQ